MEIKDLPRKWKYFAREIDRSEIPEALLGEGDGAYDVSCPMSHSTELGTMLVIEKGRFYVLSDSDYNKAIAHSSETKSPSR